MYKIHAYMRLESLNSSILYISKKYSKETLAYHPYLINQVI